MILKNFYLFFSLFFFIFFDKIIFFFCQDERECIFFLFFFSIYSLEVVERDCSVAVGRALRAGRWLADEGGGVHDHVRTVWPLDNINVSISFKLGVWA